MLLEDCFKCKAKGKGNFGYRGRYGKYSYCLCRNCRKMLEQAAKDKNKTELEILIEYERKIKW